MSRRQIAESQYEHYLERDREKGVQLTPEYRQFLWELAEDFADEMQHDAELDARGRDEEEAERVEEPAEDDDEG